MICEYLVWLILLTESLIDLSTFPSLAAYVERDLTGLAFHHITFPKNCSVPCLGRVVRDMSSNPTEAE